MSETVLKSPIATAMGAKLTASGPARGMYLVIGRDGDIERLVKAACGDVVLRLNGPKMLVTLPFAGYLMLRGKREISHIGPVTVDLKRLASVAKALSRTS